MGLPNRQYAILWEAVEAAQVTRRDKGLGAAEELIDRQVSDSCAVHHRDGDPSDGPWQ
ncbi:hypothetical protein ACVV2G_02705 [Streptomyces ziwulingensis]